jgi:hypothetical protein
MSRDEILEENLLNVDQAHLKEGHYLAMKSAMNEFADECLNDVLNKLLTKRIQIPKHSNGIAEFVNNYLNKKTK